MNTCARIVFLTGIMATFPCNAEYKRVLTTASYVVTITVNCKDGFVDCHDVNYVGKSRKDGHSIKLHGRDLTHYCPDDKGDGPGKTPCRHLGFRFKHGVITYDIWNSGHLDVWQRESKARSPRKQLIDEQGAWSNE